MSPEQAVFYLVAGIALGSALLVVSTKNMVRSIFLFFVTLFAIAGIYVFSLADFVALTQVIVYAGGVLVLMLFAFMLSDKDLLNRTVVEAPGGLNINKFAGFFIAAGFLAVLVLLIVQSDADHLGWTRDRANFSPADNTSPVIGVVLMTRYLFPFEAISIFLLMALVGAVHISRKVSRI